MITYLKKGGQVRLLFYLYYGATDPGAGAYLIPWIRIWVQDPEDGIPDSQSIF
jgi:hypothetical protein